MVIGVAYLPYRLHHRLQVAVHDTCKFVNINVSEFQALKMDAVPVADAKMPCPPAGEAGRLQVPTPLRCPPPARSGPRS